MTEARKRRRNSIKFFHGEKLDSPEPTEKELDELEKYYDNIPSLW